MQPSGQLWKIRSFISLAVAGLLLSGFTAVPLLTEIDLLYRVFGQSTAVPEAARWISFVHRGLHESFGKYPFLAYGTDWLAFGHFVIALFLAGAVVDPARNVWCLRAGMIACALVLPVALFVGELRGIPWWWRAIDCAFGILGFVPLWLAHRLLCRGPAEGA